LGAINGRERWDEEVVGMSAECGNEFLIVLGVVSGPREENKGGSGLGDRNFEC